MLSLTKLKNLLQLDDVKGLLIYIPIGMILIFLSIEYLFFIPIYILYLFYIFKQNKILFKYVLIISVFFLLAYLIKYISYRTYNIKDLYKGIVVDKNDNSILIRYRLNYIKCYIKNEDINIGDKILFNIKETNINERSVEGVFSYLKYKYSKNIKIEGNLKSFQKLKSFNIYKLKRLLVNYIESFGPNSSDYLKKLVLGMSSFSDELNSNISDTGIIYLYAISGLHISLLSLYIKKIFRLFNMKEEIISIILILFLFFYLLMCSKSSSIERAIMMISIKEIFTLLKFKFNKLDIMSISFIILIIFNPFSLLCAGTYLTYLSTLIIFFYDTKNNIKLSIVLIIFSAPLILYSNSKISIFIFLFSIFFGVIFSKFFIPFTYLVLFLPFLSFIYEKIVFVLNQVIGLLNDLNVMINFSIVNPFYLFLIYVLLFLLFKFKHFLKGKVVIISLLSFIIFLNYLHGVVSFIPTVKVIDVGQGDSILIRDYNNTYLIDTGVSDDYHTTISYLKHNNIKKIDYLFISHFDSDHDGETEAIINNINVKALVTDEISNFKKGRCDFYFYKLKGESDNDSSLVIYLKILDSTFLFTGDIESKGEEYILAKDIQNIDFLKVSHHGSNTSSSYDFLNKMNPKISLISVGLNNKYNHPNSECLKRLNDINSRVYRTDLDGSITIKIYRNFKIIKKYKSDKKYPLSSLFETDFIII